MQTIIEEAKLFTKQHLNLMTDTKEMLEEFCKDKDLYMIENSKFVMDYLT